MAPPIPTIYENANQLIRLCEETIPQIATAQRVEEVEQRHRDLKIHLDTFHQNYDLLWERLSSCDDPSCPQVQQIYQKVETIWQRFEDELLTRFPQAQIDYGRPLIGPIEASTELPMDAEMKARFPFQQRVRGDGNCFYTSFALCYLQWLCRNPEKLETALKHLLEMPNFSGKNETVQFLIDLKETPLAFERSLRSNANLFIFIAFLRHCAAHYLTNVNRDWMESYLPESPQDPQTADQYVTDHVLKMGRDAQHYEINAIIQLLGCQLWIIDSRNGLRKMNETSEAFIGAVFRSPGHYSILSTEIENSSYYSRIAAYCAIL